jgi:hypothetical protein
MKEFPNNTIRKKYRNIEILILDLKLEFSLLFQYLCHFKLKFYKVFLIYI